MSAVGIGRLRYQCTPLAIASTIRIAIETIAPAAIATAMKNAKIVRIVRLSAASLEPVGQVRQLLIFITEMSRGRRYLRCWRVAPAGSQVSRAALARAA